MVDVPRFVKWAGGKQQLLEQFEPLFPKKFNRYFEPFVGSGAVLFRINQKYPRTHAFIADINSELVDCYEVIRDAPSKIISALKRHQKNHSEKHYYKIRDVDSSKLSKEERAARFIYLNRTCYNGLHRVNSKGKFNVPIGSYTNPDVVQEERLLEVSKLLKNTKVQVASFDHVLKFTKPGDFIYFDPPYQPLENKTSFTKYAQHDFSEPEQRKLAEVFRQLDEKGCLVMLSNSDTKFVRTLYKGFKIRTVYAKRMINSKANGRGAIKEVVVTNY